VIPLNISGNEQNLLSGAIDKMNEGLDAFIQLYNEAKIQKTNIDFDEDTLKVIEEAIQVYGKETVEKKLNRIVQEILSFSKIGNDGS
jgi:hypothetical protein